MENGIYLHIFAQHPFLLNKINLSFENNQPKLFWRKSTVDLSQRWKTTVNADEEVSSTTVHAPTLTILVS